MYRITFLAVVIALPLKAQADALPLVDEVEWSSFREQVLDLLAGLKKLELTLPADTTRMLQSLLEQKKPDNTRVTARAVQKLLDAYCLVGVHVNPQSRVKATRGPRKADLILGQSVHVLVKLHNEGGVTHPLAVESEQAMRDGKPHPDRWLDLHILQEKPFLPRLSGQRVEYRLMKLTAHQAGKREATLSFDVGQGTQDLGFRSEVPILFTIRKK